jgi:hypothetical protein
MNRARNAMKWFRENRFLGTFLVLFGVALIAATWFLLSAKSGWDAAMLRFNRTAAELNRLERLAPYPNEENLRKMKADAEDYGSALAKLKEELKLRVAPVTPMKPNEFQSRLRVAVAAIVLKARSSKVKLPDKFYLGFDEFAGALPNEVAAPVLGQELSQIEWLLNGLIEGQIEALTAFHRPPLPEEHGSPAVILSPSTAPATKSAATPSPGAKLLSRNVVEATFVSTPAAARRVLNQLAGANEPFCIIRLLHVRNEKQKGPPHEAAPETPGLVAAKPSPVTGLNFIVGNERIETTAKIEIVRFMF